MDSMLPCGHVVANEAQPHYCSHLRLTELLQLQPPDERLHHPDEHLFVIIHQTFELLFKQVLFDLHRIIAALDSDDTGLSIWLARRLTHLSQLFVSLIQILEGMAPSDFFAFRGALAPASGLESQQFREIEIRAGLRDEDYRSHLQMPAGINSLGLQTCLWTDHLQIAWESRSLNEALMDLFQRRHVTIDALYTIAPTPNPHADLFLLGEALLDFDATIALWRATHLVVAERAIGSVIAGTGRNANVRALVHSPQLQQRHFFPALWQARTLLWERLHPSSDNPA